MPRFLPSHAPWWKSSPDSPVSRCAKSDCVTSNPRNSRILRPDSLPIDFLSIVPTMRFFS